MSDLDDRFHLLDQIPLGICILQSNFVVVFWNRCLEEWTKISRDRILGCSICEFFPHFNQPLYRNRLDPIFAGGPPTIFSSQLHKHLIPATLSNGQNRIQHTTVTAIPALENDGFYAMLSIQDVTDLTFQAQEYRQMRDRALAEAEERKLAQERAETANRVKDEFLAIVSHELRTPLNPILGWSKLLLDGKLPGATAQHALGTIAKNAALQVQLIDDLLDVSRILRGKLTLHWEMVDLVGVVQSALDTVRLMAENKAIAIRFQPETTASVLGDATRLQQVVWNLLTNAIKFTPEGGQIEITLCRENRFVRLSVQDTGEGIATDFLPYVFESFRQADASTTRRVGGLGLGLAITRHLVELHSGTIEVRSLGSGKGSTFTLTFPLAQSHSEDNSSSPTDTSQDSQLSLCGLQILIVDDEQDTRDLLLFVLEDCGATVTTVGSVAEAIAAIHRQKPDLIVSDVGLSDADGINLLQYVRSRSQELGVIPVIALTPCAAEVTEQLSTSAEFQRQLAKPINPCELIQLASLLTVSEQR